VFANHSGLWKAGIGAILMLAVSSPALGQSEQQKTRVFTLEEAVNFALKNYPAVRASLEDVSPRQVAGPRHRQQHCGADHTQLRDRSDYGASHCVAVEPQCLGKCGWAAVLLGAA